MNRRNAITIILGMLTGRLVARPEKPLIEPGITLTLPDPDKQWHVFTGRVLNIEIDGRHVTLTAREIADALGAK